MAASSTVHSRTRRDKLRVPPSMSLPSPVDVHQAGNSRLTLLRFSELPCLPSRWLHQTQVTNNSKGMLPHRYQKRGAP